MRIKVQVKFWVTLGNMGSYIRGQWIMDSGKTVRESVKVVRLKKGSGGRRSNDLGMGSDSRGRGLQAQESTIF